MKYMSNLTKHAQEELKRAGLFDKDSDYGGMLGDAVLELIKTFAKQDHSGMSASMTIYLFEKLAKFENISDLTDDPKEWIQHQDDMWQSNRRSTAFSNDKGKTYYDIDEEGRPTHKTKKVGLDEKVKE